MFSSLSQWTETAVVDPAAPQVERFELQLLHLQELARMVEVVAEELGQDIASIKST